MDSDGGLYYTVGNRGSDVGSGVLSIDLSKSCFEGTTVEVKELVTNRTSTQNVEAGKLLITISELHPYTLVYKIS